MIQIPITPSAPIPWTKTASEHTALALGIFALIGIVIRFCAWIRKLKKERIDRKNALQETLDNLCKGQSDIYDRLETMDRTRTDARVEDLKMHQSIIDKIDLVTADVRLSVSAGVTALDGIIQLGNGTGVKVNGPVLRMRDKMQDRIEEGIGEPHPPKPKKGGPS